MEVIAFKTAYDAGQTKLGSTPPAMSGPQWMIDLLPITYRAFDFGPSSSAGAYGAFPVLPSRSITIPPIIQ